MSYSALEKLSLPERQATLESGRAGIDPQNIPSRTFADLDEPLRPAVKINWWRTLNTIAILGLGAAKVISTYQENTTALNTLDWIIVVSWILISYWCSIVESESPDTVPWLFKHNPQIPTVVVTGSAPFLFYFVVSICHHDSTLATWNLAIEYSPTDA
ncbi:hypothetical protein CVT25_015694 [Psilocybe cyanescens]|uniref:Uncharacterized protein n=1 Tax=Psilocybe cyanescens TaxID=93625 RepID=A0A409XJQ0_PSICY|nr:hypothetical protein CVT25_015694 [Psilocybe cyanescens]